MVRYGLPITAKLIDEQVDGGKYRAIDWPDIP
jgi:hypothetical protein